MKYIFIVNCRKDKAAIREEVERELSELQEEISSRCDEVVVYLTTGEGDATRAVRLYCDLHPNEKVCFVACGGDGTVNEVASGLVGSPNKTLAVLALHSVNDFVRYYPDRQFTSIRGIFAGEDCQIDIMKVNDSYSINVCQVGIEAVVSRIANELSERGKNNVFQRGLIRALFVGRHTRADIIADGEKIGRRRLLLCTMGNGRYVGDGGFLTAPRAINDDGLIEFCYLRSILFIRMLSVMKCYSQGKYLEHPRFSKLFIYRQVKHVEIHAPQLIELSLDGELLPGTNFDIQILPKAVTLRLPGKVGE